MLQRFDSTPRRAAPEGRRLTVDWLLPFAVAFALRAAYAWIACGPGGQPYSDSADYDLVAWNLALGHGFALEGAAGPYPTAFRPPLLPWMTSLLYRVVGHHYFAAVLLQCAVGALIPVMLAAFGAAMAGAATGRLAGWITALHPLLIFFSGYLMTENLFTLAFLLALYLSAEWVKTPRGGRAFGAGIAWGLANLARPTAVPLVLGVLAWAWAPLGLTVPGRERARQMLLLLLGLALVVGPWTARNAIVLRAFVPVTTSGGSALYVGNNEMVWGDPARRGGATSGAWDRLVTGEFRGLSETEIDARARALAVAFLRDHRREWPAMAMAKLARFWRLSAVGGGGEFWSSHDSPIARLLAVLDPLRLWSLLLFPLAAWGAILAVRGPRRWFQSLSLWVILYFSLLAVVFFGTLRMRMPIEPLIALLAAAGIMDLRRRLLARARGLRVIEARG
jgi:4-amino-4-deoxy-L-arabinose transferase-like glycosyltransferase